MTTASAVRDERAATSEEGTPSILERARIQVLGQGIGLDEAQLVEILKISDDDLPAALELAHEVRLKYCGDDVEVEGIVSIKTGGCPEDCHFCSQSGVFDSPVRSVWLDIPALVEAAKETAATGASEFCIVAAVRGPDIKLMNQIKFAIDRINKAVEINIACSLGMLTQRQVDQLAEWGVHRYNHNLETARSFFPEVVTTHTYEERLETCEMVRAAGMELCCGALIGMGESLEQRAELAAQLAALEPHEVPLNFLNPRPGTPLEDQGIMDGKDALRAIVAFRLAMPRTVLRYAGGRELTLGDLGTREGLLGGINAVIVGNYLTTLGRPADADIKLLVELNMPIKELQK
ncbi:MAG: biotin synthase BioB, partial [Salinibacterium sp.]